MIRICHRPGRNEDERQFDVCVTTYEMVLKNLSNLKHFAWQYVYFSCCVKNAVALSVLLGCCSCTSQGIWSSMKDIVSRTKTRFCRKRFVNCTHWIASCWQVHKMRNSCSLKYALLWVLTWVIRIIIFLGTPLQNNLHEMWALLNFLLPEVCRWYCGHLKDVW